MEKLSPEEIEIVKEAGQGYINPNRFKMDKARKVKAKLSEDNPSFDGTEMAQMFEFVASYASDNHEKLIVDSLRERLRKFKFPPDGIER